VIKLQRTKKQDILPKLYLKYLEELVEGTKGLLREEEKTNLKKMMQ